MMAVVSLNVYRSVTCLCPCMASSTYVHSAWYFVYKVVLWSLILTRAPRERHYCDLGPEQGLSSTSNIVRWRF